MILTAREPTVLLADSKAKAENDQQKATDKAANSPKCEWIMVQNFKQRYIFAHILMN